jgi:hypothetical protein
MQLEEMPVAKLASLTEGYHTLSTYMARVGLLTPHGFLRSVLAGFSLRPFWSQAFFSASERIRRSSSG